VEVPMTPPTVSSPPPSPGDEASIDHTEDSDADALAPDSDGKPEGERERLVWAMERCGWVQAKAARLLKISPRQMGYALQKNAIEVRKF